MPAPTDYDDAHPITLFEQALESNDWPVYTSDEDEDCRVTVITAMHCQLMLTFTCPPSQAFASFSFGIVLPGHIPNGALAEIYELINLMNVSTTFGRWYYQPRRAASENSVNLMCWRYELPVDQLGEDGDVTISCLLADCTETFDRFYPVVMGFFSAKPRLSWNKGEVRFVSLGKSPTEAMAYLTQVRLVGRA